MDKLFKYLRAWLLVLLVSRAVFTVAVLLVAVGLLVGHSGEVAFSWRIA